MEEKDITEIVFDEFYIHSDYVNMVDVFYIVAHFMALFEAVNYGVMMHKMFVICAELFIIEFDVVQIARLGVVVSLRIRIRMLARS